MVDHAREAKAIASGLEGGSACQAIAGRIFPHNNDFVSREKLTEELVAFFVPIISRIDELEKHSHPPVDLLPLIRAEIDKDRRRSL